MPCRSENPSGDEANRPPRPGPLEWLFGFPRAVYDQGTQHGREWHRICASQDSSGKKNDHDSRWQQMCERHRPMDCESRIGAQSAGASDSPPDWSSWVRRELDRGEKVARSMYDSWEKEHGRGNPAGPSDSDRKDHSQMPMPVLAGQLWKPLEEMEHDLRKIFTKLGKEMEDVEQMSNRYGPEFWEFYMLNPYSPLRLEHEAGFDSSWRTRFEDLIRAEKQQQLLSKEEAAVTQRQSAFDWFHGLQSRVNHPAAGSSPRTDDPDRQTELDAYNRVLPVARSDGLVDAFEKYNLQAESRRQETSEPEVKTVFRTVNRYAEKDGSFTTKTVVRKTFADGRTEKTETVETSPPRQEPPKVDAANPTRIDGAPKRGWFWSS